MARLFAIYLEEISFVPPHWVNAAGPNKGKAMWFSTVHKSVFHAANSKRHMLFCLPLPPCPLPKLVISLKSNASRTVSSESWGFLMSSVPFLPDSHRWSVLCTASPTLEIGGQEAVGAEGSRWSAMAVLSRSAEGSTSLNANCEHMGCVY